MSASSAPPGTKKGDPPNYTFDTSSSIHYEVTQHSRTFKCKINGVPRPQYRSFAHTRASASKVQMWDPSKKNKNSFQKAFQQALLQANTRNIFSLQNKPCSITVRFFFPRPKNHYNYNYSTGTLTLRHDAPTYVTKVPDLDNCLKLVVDALQKVCYDNDCVVAHIDAAKLFDHTQTTWHEHNSGCTIIKVTEIDETIATPTCKCLSCKTKTL